eukprot:TRINITY_DN63190_c0_g1_i1.p1 TRINITY_DN63190_c0_g1~~TRINITY_DN63190_c0_g1_i1.p1  ORF type:complete len:787 (-),score=39.45 TRINITY_DN63190_c0_g1_i1:84-2444(-)
MPDRLTYSGSGSRSRSSSSESDTSSAGITTPRKKKRKTISIDISQCKYDIVRKVVQELGWRICNDGTDDFHVFWTDLSVSAERVMRLHHAHKRVNHFPSMDLIGRKIPLAINVGRMHKQFPDDFDFLPRTYVDFKEFLADRAKEVGETDKKRRKKIEQQFFIVKPNNGCMGKGIFLTSKPTSKMFDNAVVQEYVPRPLLIEGLKFDLRCYVLLRSAQPLRIFMFNDGLVRLCAEPYQPPTDENIKNTCTHITNYAVNKKSASFVFNQDATKGDEGNKRNFGFLNRWLTSHGHDTDEVWDSVHDLVIKTFLSISKILAQSYKSCVIHEWDDESTCFELLGFDILLDQDLKPWLLEVNHSPSLVTDTPLDYQIKYAVIRETLQLVNVGQYKAPKGLHVSERRSRFEDKVLDGFVRIYPPAVEKGTDNPYNQFINPHQYAHTSSSTSTHHSDSFSRRAHSHSTSHRSRSSTTSTRNNDNQDDGSRSSRGRKSVRRHSRAKSSSHRPITHPAPSFPTPPPHRDASSSRSERSKPKQDEDAPTQYVQHSSSSSQPVVFPTSIMTMHNTGNSPGGGSMQNNDKQDMHNTTTSSTSSSSSSLLSGPTWAQRNATQPYRKSDGEEGECSEGDAQSIRSSGRGRSRESNKSNSSCNTNPRVPLSHRDQPLNPVTIRKPTQRRVSLTHVHPASTSSSTLSTVTNSQHTTNPYLSSVIRTTRNTSSHSTKVIPFGGKEFMNLPPGLYPPPGGTNAIGRRKFVEKFKRIVESADVTPEVKSSLVHFLMLENGTKPPTG